jgi:hypothetical protein
MGSKVTQILMKFEGIRSDVDDTSPESQSTERDTQAQRFTDLMSIEGIPRNQGESLTFEGCPQAEQSCVFSR